MSFTYTTPILIVADQTSATFESVPPYEFGWASTGAINLYLDNWANVDNTLDVDVYWGVNTKGLLATNANIQWEKDLTLSRRFTAAAGTTTDVPGTIDLPRIKGKFIKLGFTLAGTSKEVDVIAYFHGKSDGGGGNVLQRRRVYHDAGSVTKASVKGGAGLVKFVRVTNANAAVRYFQLHNKATAPAAAENAFEPFLIPAGTAAIPAVVQLGLSELGDHYNLDTGIGWAISTTETAFTDSATASEHSVAVHYV
jgi:hypothetical protein